MPDNLTRVTSGSRFIPEIDGLRFLAIFPVVIMHFTERLSRANSASLTDLDQKIVQILSNGHVGVYLFFAISGFILALPFGNQKLNNKGSLSLSKYYLRRLTRLEPPYLIVMILLFMALVLIKKEDFKDLVPHLAASIFYVHRIIYGTWSPINPPAWTLEIEVQFYAIAPFLAILYFTIEKKWVRRSLILSLILLKIVVDNTSTLFDPTYLTLPFVVQFFLIGIVMADIFLTDWKTGIIPLRIFDFISIISFIIMLSTWTWGKDLSWKFVYIISLLILFYGSFRSMIFNNFLKNKWVTAIGGMCYTIYLLHLVLAEAFVLIFQKLNLDIAFAAKLIIGLALFLPLLFIISSIFFILIEKPCMDPEWPKKLRGWIVSVFSFSR
jgi:peptidoglycan/LPS O-acetylase OafA/YrhL